MGSVSLFLKQFVVALVLCSVSHDVSGSDIKYDSLDFKEKQIYLLNNVDISNEYEFGIRHEEAVCNDSNKCYNGARCYNSTCICLPGNSGPLCRTINGCSDLNCERDKNSYCDFDKRKFNAFCKCPWGQKFDYDDNKCKDCLCGNCKEGRKCDSQVKCEIFRGEKVCTCHFPYYKFNPKTKMCEFCSCGENAVDCDFDKNGDQLCSCERDYAQKYEMCKRCKCDNANDCKFVKFEKVCNCVTGYIQDGGDCYECKCGKNGKCLWEDWAHIQRGCICNPGFTEVNGICIEVSECYCGENSNCTLKNNEKNCSCQEGFADINGLCTDINECDTPNICPEGRRCFNLIGSYNCSCTDGFHPTIEGECEDIDECQNAESCTGLNTECINTAGSYSCVCKAGYASHDAITLNPICENAMKKWIFIQQSHSANTVN